jgi:hypothetical protein
VSDDLLITDTHTGELHNRYSVVGDVEISCSNVVCSFQFFTKNEKNNILIEMIQIKETTSDFITLR